MWGPSGLKPLGFHLIGYIHQKSLFDRTQSASIVWSSTDIDKICLVRQSYPLVRLCLQHIFATVAADGRQFPKHFQLKRSMVIGKEILLIVIRHETLVISCSACVWASSRIKVTSCTPDSLGTKSIRLIISYFFSTDVVNVRSVGQNGAQKNKNEEKIRFNKHWFYSTANVVIDEPALVAVSVWDEDCRCSKVLLCIKHPVVTGRLHVLDKILVLFMDLKLFMMTDSVRHVANSSLCCPPYADCLHVGKTVRVEAIWVLYYETAIYYKCKWFF